ncbi:hypothetical protein Bca4012_036888 [Brassica carinata]
MSSARKSTKRSPPEPQSLKKQAQNAKLQDDCEDLDVSGDIKGIMSALQQMREKADEDGRKKKTCPDGYKRNHADELFPWLTICRQNFAKTLSKSSKECESILKDEAAKFEQLHHKFMKEKADHLQGLKDTISKFEEDKERLYMRYEQLSKPTPSNEIIDEKNFSILRKTLGSFLENEASDEEFPPNE